MPSVIVSSKVISKEKASATTTDRFGNVVTMEELMKKSKEGQVGKGGAKIK
jgi:hypothetical protein